MARVRRTFARRGRLRRPRRRTVLLGVFLLTGAYLAWVELTVARHFSGALWPEPARVFAAPLELYAGRALAQSDLVRELRRLGYEERPGLDRPGSFLEDPGGTLVVRTRGFRFSDGEEPSRLLRARFDAGRLSELTADSTGAAIPVTRLDPLLIGSIYPREGEDRLILARDQFPPLLVDALLAVEDRTFYTHLGVDPRGLARALVTNLRSGAVVQGGSTLTQQLIKNRIAGRDRSLLRKGNELFLALAAERWLTKDEILHGYLNEIYMGQDGDRPIHGFGLASYFYFARPVRELDLHEIALLVGLVKGPSYYDPLRFPERARQRRDLILDVLAEQGVVSEPEAEAARMRPLELSPRRMRGTTSYPAMIDLVRRQLRRHYPERVLDSEGLRIFTTLDPAVQERAEQALASGLERLERGHGLPEGDLEGAIVVTSVDGAEVLAVVGGREARFDGFNRAIDAFRPVGSVLKPAVYLAALESGRYTWATTVLDSAIEVPRPDGSTWVPRNHDEQELGPIPMFQALIRSQNLATVRVALDVGIDRVVDVLHRLGIEQELPAYPSLALGAVDLAPLDVAQVYATLASGGFRTPVNALRAVQKSDGEISRRYPLRVEQALDRGLVYMVDEALALSTRKGTAAPLDHLLPEELEVAGKTGTSDEYRDSWFAGFTGEHVAVVRVGYDDSTSAGLSGTSGALTLWASLMGSLSTRSYDPVLPEGLEEVWIHESTGLREAEGCPEAVRLAFVEGTAPEQRGDCRSESIGRRAVKWIKGLFDGE